MARRRMLRMLTSMHRSEAMTWLKLSIVETVSCDTVSLEEMVPPKAVSVKTLKMVQKIVTSRPIVVVGAKSPKPKVLRPAHAHARAVRTAESRATQMHRGDVLTKA